MRPDARANRRLAVLTAVLGASLVSTAVHYTDNYIAFDSYPGSDSISRIEVPISWVVLTAIGIAGYVLYRRGRYRPAHVLLGAYALTGLTTPLHYTEGSPADLTVWRNISIMGDGVIGAAVLAVVLWSWSTRDRLVANREPTPA
jgi:hypothetical protein